MRFRSIATVLMLTAGCASQPKSPPVTPVVTQGNEPPTETVVATMAEVMKAGYDLVDENGKTLYCRQQLMTGSHLRKETICLTAEELKAAREASQRNLEQLQRAIAPPQGK